MKGERIMKLEKEKMKYLITGDKHSHFSDVFTYIASVNNPTTTTIIVLGDAGINYYGFPKDDKLKSSLNKIGCTFFCIHGNHEMRPESLPTYQEMKWNDGIVYVEKDYSNLLFAKDGEIYNINGKKTLVIGGAYSVDRDYRIRMNPHCPFWWPDEQPSDIIKKRVENKLEENNWNVDIVLSHTVPLKYEPTEAFIEGMNQDMIDKSTEKWLQTIEDRLTCQKWYAGHYHVEKCTGKLEILYHNIHEL